MDLSEEDFANVGPDDSRKKVESAFPSSPFARQASEMSPEPTNAFDDIGEDDFEEEYEEDGFEVDEDDDFGPASEPCGLGSRCLCQCARRSGGRNPARDRSAQKNLGNGRRGGR